MKFGPIIIGGRGGEKGGDGGGESSVDNKQLGQQIDSGIDELSRASERLAFGDYSAVRLSDPEQNTLYLSNKRGFLARMNIKIGDIQKLVDQYTGVGKDSYKSALESYRDVVRSHTSVIDGGGNRYS